MSRLKFLTITILSLLFRVRERKIIIVMVKQRTKQGSISMPGLGYVGVVERHDTFYFGARRRKTSKILPCPRYCRISGKFIYRLVSFVDLVLDSPSVENSIQFTLILRAPFIFMFGHRYKNIYISIIHLVLMRDKMRQTDLNVPP